MGSTVKWTPVEWGVFILIGAALIGSILTSWLGRRHNGSGQD